MTKTGSGSDPGGANRVCNKRQSVGNVCLHLMFGLSCSAFPGGVNICMIEAESRQPDCLSDETKRRMRKAKRIDSTGAAACVILEA